MNYLKCLIGYVCLLMLPQANLGDSGASESALFFIDTRWLIGDAGGSGTDESALFIIDARGAGKVGSLSSALMTIDTRDGQHASSLLARVQLQGSTTSEGVTVSAWQNGVRQATAQTTVSGEARLNGLPEGYYEVRAVRAGYAPAIRSFLRVPQDTESGLDMVLIPQPPNIPVMKTDLSAQQLSVVLARPDFIQQAHLKQWNGTTFVPLISVEESKMTIILTHGWNSSLDRWPTDMAKALTERLQKTEKSANIVAWDWRAEAEHLVKARLDTPNQGLALGKSLREELGANYAMPLHFIGHSLGTLVNAAAANYVHDDDPRKDNRVTPAWDYQRTHMTLFDHAGIASDQYRFESAQTGLADPVPKHSAYVDSYLTAVGVYKENALNVFLQKELYDHGFPYKWYMDTVANPRICELGFRYSFENLRENARFPVPDLYDMGTIFVQDPKRQDNWALIDFGKPDGLLDYAALKFVQDTKLVLTAYRYGVEGAEWLVDTTVSEATKKGQVAISSVVYGLYNHYDGSLDPMNDPDYGVGNTTPAVLNIPGYAESSAPKPACALQLKLQTTPPLPVQPFRPMSTIEPPAANTPAYVWLPVRIPSNTVAMTFDFQLSGDGVNDWVTAGINTSNLFSLPCQFIPSDQWQSSGTLMVEQWAGQDVELFFGVAGGTSTNATITIEGIRFLGVPQPRITTWQKDGHVLLQWPQAAPGYVLEFTPNLSSSTTWSPLTNVIKVNGDNYYTNTAPEETGYYRLQRKL